MSHALNFPNQQLSVDNYFDSVAPQWKKLYRDRGLKPAIFAYRQSVALEWLAQSLTLENSDVLDVGCGAGPASVVLASRGARVKAIDTVPRMVNLTRQSAKERGLSSLIEPSVGDVHSLRFADNTFDAVVAIGVVYWLHSPRRALREIMRVLKPGGHLVVSGDNADRITYTMDPGHLPSVLALRRSVGRALRATGLRQPASPISVNRYSVRKFDELLTDCEFEKLKGTTVGFGPFSFLECKVIPEFIGIRVHRILQHLAEKPQSTFSSAGNHYVVLARKPL
jgi:ubiquinone/menaquinone biosynthesis C-methylase UbiE